jgi:N-methylhydantoinase B
VSDALDPIDLEVARNALVAIPEEMNATLVRTAYSPNVKEREDCSCAVFAVELLAQAENIPVHLGAMPFSVAAAFERFPPAELSPGDAVLLNDPFHGGAHLPDLTLVSPVFVDGDLVAAVANRAHHADVGGARGGSVAADSTEIYAEGLRIPPVKLVRGGDVDAGVRDVLLANVRTPAERRGDLRAQRAANETGRRRFEAFAAEREDLRAATKAVTEYAERRTRAAIRELPDGEYAFEDRLDDDGRGTEDLPVRATVTVDGDEIVVDFAGTAARTEGPVNAPFAVTASATYYAVRAVTDPDVTPSAGCYRPVEIRTPEDSIVDAEPPAAVVGGNLETSQRVTDVVLGAFAGAAPERVSAAGQGTMNNVTLAGRDPREDRAGAGDRAYTFYETGAGGAGAAPTTDGMDGVHVHMSNTLNTPVEVLETAYPLRVRRYEYRPDSGGAGEHRGGLGLRRDIEVVDHEATVSLLAERHRSRPYGLAGGEPGASGEALLDPDGDAERLPAKCTRRLAPGTVLSVRSPGGGGHGDPDERDRAAVLRDLRLGKLSAAAARERYGVEVEDAGDAAED